MRQEKSEIIIAGAGGQGVLLAGIILAQAALEDEKYTTWFPSYGAEIRGGVANSQVVIANYEIASPVITRPDYLVILNQQSMDKFSPRLKKDGLSVVNSSLIDIKSAGQNILPVDATRLSEKHLGSPRFANIIMLGALIKKIPIVTNRALEKAIEVIFSQKMEIAQLNKEALKTGLNL